jgi:hypothetical protein
MSGETRRERIVIETARHKIIGEVTLPAEGYRTRLSDLLNREGLEFVPLVNASVSSVDGGELVQRRFIAVAREAIQVAYEDNNELGRED